jgi:serine/threonine protein kinase
MPDLTRRILGPYQILEQLGLGGMFTLYRAYQPKQDRYVIIRVPSEYLLRDPVSVERFKREVEVLDRLRHPSIVSLLEYGEEEGIPYQVYEKLDGSSLEGMFDRASGQPLSLSDAVNISTQVAGALGHAHSLGIVHRDVKPTNIFVTAHGRALLLDFGLATAVKSSIEHGMLVGTPEYMAPELPNGLVDHRYDLYSLGVVFYEMVTGRVPFRAHTPIAVIFQHLTEPVPSPLQFNPNLPEGVERVLLKALSKNPADRYQTAGEMTEAINKFIVTALDREADKEVNRVTLHRVLAERFDLEELRTLCFDLGVAFDDLRGEGHKAKARELIAYLERRNRLNQLASCIRELRSDIESI